MSTERFRVSLSALAVRQLREIHDYIAAEGSPLSAQRHSARLLKAIARLEQAPFIGRPSLGDTRELTTVRPHLIRYRVMDGEVVVIRIRHGARRPD